MLLRWDGCVPALWDGCWSRCDGVGALALLLPLAPQASLLTVGVLPDGCEGMASHSRLFSLRFDGEVSKLCDVSKVGGFDVTSILNTI